RAAILIALAGCWRGQPPVEPAPVEPSPAPVRVKPRRSQPVEHVVVIPNVPRPPPATCGMACAPVHTRILKALVVGSDVELTLGAGTQHGVTTSWRASLEDASHAPVLGGGIRITRVER